MDDPAYFITCALPYANGPLHLGHMVEYIQADIYVRFLRLKGRKVYFVCADDAHGTPIEINAKKQGISPERLVAQVYESHKSDFAGFDISFDNFYTTNSPENLELSTRIFGTLKERGHIYEDEILLTYCEKDGRFLPDRYVKGSCPRCGAPDQYGDVCEKCNSTYSPTELIEPRCAVCGNIAVQKKSRHFFFRLSSFSQKLEDWIVKSPGIQEEVKNFVLSWIRNGLQDWCISRDGPYFGFRIPGAKDKYFYVWLDAPIGYFASLMNLSARDGFDGEEIISGKNARMYHFIGKDIVYFHLLFWPAMLMACDLIVPSRIQVHGFLTIGKEKMSKSRGTFLTARQYLDALPPEFLKFYFASSLGRRLDDIDLDWSDFLGKVNNELLSNIANFAYRVLSFCAEKFEGNSSEYTPDENLESERLRLISETEASYEKIELREAVRRILQLSDLGNRFFQSSEPWKLVRDDRKRAQEVVSEALALVQDLAILIGPICPSFSSEIQRQLGMEQATWRQLGKKKEPPSKISAGIVLRKLDDSAIGKLRASDPLDTLGLRVALIEDVQDHPNAEKLYVLKLDLGTEKRQLVAGLRPYYEKQELLGKHIVVVANLEHAKLRGIESQGMLLAGDDGKNVKVLEAPDATPGESLFAGDKLLAAEKKIPYAEFAKFSIFSEGGKAFIDGRTLKAKESEVRASGLEGRARVR